MQNDEKLETRSLAEEYFLARIKMEERCEELEDKLTTVRTILRAIDYTQVPDNVTDCLMDAIKACEE